jgi:hypothetical protein
MSFLYQRYAVSITTGLIVGALVFLARHNQPINGDFWRPFVTAQSLFHGVSPYRIFGYTIQGFPNLYPATVGVILFPFLGLQFWVAASLFSGISAGLLAFGLSKDGYERFPLFVSLPFWIAAYSSQWSIISSAAFLLPALSWVYLAKPSIGLGLLVARWRESAVLWFVLVGAVIVLTSIILVPNWPTQWIESVRTNSAHMKAPITMPGGFIALLALKNWRDPKARLLVVMSLIPQNIAWYDSVPLYLIPGTMMQSLVLVGVSSLPIVMEVLRHGGSDGVIDLFPKGYELALCFYLPCVVMVLKSPTLDPTSWWNRSSNTESFHA